MADVQIHPLGVEATPADYSLPQAQGFQPKLVYAHFDGSAAGSAFVPTLEIVSDAGTVIAQIPQDLSVAAGGSAEATWGSFLRAGGGGGSGASTTRFAYSGPQLPFKVCPAGSGTLLGGNPTSFFTSSTADFAQGAYVHGGNTYYGTKILTPGHYLGLAYFAVLQSGGGIPPAASHYNVVPALNDGDLEESFFLFGDTNYMAVSNSDYPISTLYGDLGTVTTPTTEFHNPWIFTFDNNGAFDLEALVGTLMLKFDSDSTSLT